jgi:hypothetical protein
MRSRRIADEVSSRSSSKYRIAATRRPELARMSAYMVSFELKTWSAWLNFTASWSVAIFSTRSCRANFCVPCEGCVVQMATVFGKLPAQM